MLNPFQHQRGFHWKSDRRGIPEVHPPDANWVEVPHGSSPRSRGTYQLGSPLSPSWRFIPALAGNIGWTCLPPGHSNRRDIQAVIPQGMPVGWADVFLVGFAPIMKEMVSHGRDATLGNSHQMSRQPFYSYPGSNVLYAGVNAIKAMLPLCIQNTQKAVLAYTLLRRKPVSRVPSSC